MTGDTVTPGSFTALVLAASRGPDDPVAAAENVSHKALIDVAGAPMLKRVVDALAQSRAVGRIAIGIDEPAVLETLGDPSLIAAPIGDTPGASVLTGAAALEGPYPLLVTTGDHPLLTAEMVDRFCADALVTGADVAAGLATKDIILREYPDAQRTFIKFSDGPVSGCNLFAMLTPGGLKAAEFWGRIEQERKRPWRLVKAFGVTPFLLYGLGLLTRERAFARAGRCMGITAAPVLLPWADAAIDVDKPADLELVRTILGRGR